MKQSYFLSLDDEVTTKADGYFCGADCTRIGYKFNISTAVPSTLYIKLYTWPRRTYPRSCVVTGN